MVHPSKIALLKRQFLFVFSDFRVFVIVFSDSMVACQPAIDLSVLLLVAGDAKSHLETYRPQTVHGLNFAMAIGAIQLTPEDMRLVIELYIIRYVVDLNPWHRSIGVVMLSFPYDLGVLGNDVLMAEETFLHCREPGVLRAIHKGVAKSAIDLLDTCMHPMAEIDGLARADALIWIKVIEI